MISDQWENPPCIIKTCLKSYYWSTTRYSSTQLFYSLTQQSCLKDGASLTLPKTGSSIVHRVLDIFESFELEFFATLCQNKKSKQIIF